MLAWNEQAQGMLVEPCMLTVSVPLQHFEARQLFEIVVPIRITRANYLGLDGKRLGIVIG